MEKSLVRIFLGSLSDRKIANIILCILKEIGIPYRVSIGSCHWHSDAGLEKLVKNAEENVMVAIGGMQFNLPSIVETINKVNWETHKLVLAIPTDKIAKHANEDFPFGTVVFMAGFNSIDPEAGYKNSALGIAKLLAFRYPDYFVMKLDDYYKNLAKKKELQKEVVLVDGLIPEPEKKL